MCTLVTGVNKLPSLASSQEHGSLTSGASNVAAYRWRTDEDLNKLIETKLIHVCLTPPSWSWMVMCDGEDGVWGGCCGSPVETMKEDKYPGRVFKDQQRFPQHWGDLEEGCTCLGGLTFWPASIHSWNPWPSRMPLPTCYNACKHTSQWNNVNILCSLYPTYM